MSVKTLMTTEVKLKESIEEQKFANGDDDEAVQNGPTESNKLLTKDMPVYANWQYELSKST